MPLYGLYTKQVSESPLADLNNISGSIYGGSCTAAAFLQVNQFSKDLISLKKKSVKCHKICKKLFKKIY